MVAYAAWREQAGEIYVRDAAVVSRPVAIELLRAFRDVGFHKVCDQFNVAMPMGYPLTEAMRGLGCFEKRRFPSGAGCMGRVINLGSLAVRMRREWMHLVKRSEFAGRTARLRLEIDGNLLTIDCGPRGIRTQNSHARASSRVSWRRLAQMLLGYRSIAALADESDVKFAKQDLRLLEVLFPERNAHILGPDRF